MPLSSLASLIREGNDPIKVNPLGSNGRIVELNWKECFPFRMTWCCVYTASCTRFPQHGSQLFEDSLALFSSQSGRVVLKANVMVSEAYRRRSFPIQTLPKRRFGVDFEGKMIGGVTLNSVSDGEPSNERFEFPERNGHPAHADRKPEKRKRKPGAGKKAEIGHWRKV
jgi:hypothetical protein